MTPQEAIFILEQHQLWRRGLPPYDELNTARIRMPNPPQKLGEAIDMALDAMKATPWKPASSALTAQAELKAQKIDLLELLTLSLPYVDEGERFNKHYSNKLSNQIRALISKVGQ